MLMARHEKKRDFLFLERKRLGFNQLRATPPTSQKINQKRADKILEGISALRQKFTWSEQGFGWMNSKERKAMMQYKKVNKLGDEE